MKKNAVNLMMLIFAIMINIIAINAQTKSPSVEVVDENNNKQNLILKKLDIDIKVVGNLAVTTMDMTFTNDFHEKSRALEGTLIFPLAEGQSVNRLAMDFNEIMREGVIVEKEKGRVVFEEIERRGVDPALLEMTTSNNYKLRIFPILPGKERRIIIAYEEILKSNADGMAYNLPLEFEKEIKEFTLRANVFNEVQPIVNGKAAFEKDDNSYNLEYEYSDYKAKEMFSFSIPTPENQKSILCEMIDGDRFFVINRSIEIPKAEKLTANIITILWDCSHSSNKRDIKKEIELLREYFKMNPNCSVEFITFNYKIKTKEEFKITNGNADELIKAIEKVRYDGGSNFDCIDLSKTKSDMIMMFTDGITSLGNSKRLESKAPINTINSNLSANNFYLNDIANTSGGSYINLLNCEVESALKVLTENQYRLISIENNSSETEEIFPRSAQNLIQDLSIGGKLKSDKAEIKLNFGYGNKIEKTETIIIDADENEVESNILNRIWAKKKLDNLAENPKKNKAEMLAIGQKYNIVSQNTSLIVLETARDYMKYKIEPPKSDKVLYEAYSLYMENDKKAEEERTKYAKKNTNLNLERLIDNFKMRKEWYDTEYLETLTKNEIIEKERANRFSMSERIANQKGRIDSLNSVMKHKNDGTNCVGSGIVKGKVLLNDLTPASGASVRIKIKNKGSKVKTNGEFQIFGVPCGIWILQVKYLGSTVEIPVEIVKGIETNIGELYIENKKNTEDVVVVADRTQRNIARTSAGSVISESSAQSNYREGLSAIVGSQAGVVENDSTPQAIGGSRIQPEELKLDGIEVYVPLNGGGKPGNSSTDRGFTIRGSRAEETVVRIDGIEVSNPLNGGGRAEAVEVIAERADIARTTARVRESETKHEEVSNDDIRQASPLRPVSKNNSGNQIQGKAVPIVESKTELSAYSSSEAYFAEMKALEGEAFWDKYFEHKAKFVNAIGYYIDVAELLTQKNNPEDAEEVITNIAELGDENQEFMRVVAYKLQNLKKYDLAKNVFEYIAEIRAEEPQSFRDLAIINEEMGNYQTAADLYYKVVIGEWDWRFSGIEITALTELNALIAKHPKEINTTKFNPELIFAMPLDVRVVLRWDLDNTDIDLWVTDSRNEKCWYGNKNTKIGGLLPRDFTAGNGPEEFLLKTAMKGKYVIECNYFGSRATKLTGGTTIFLDIYTNYGKPNEKKETKVMRLKEDKQTIKIGEIEIE